MPTTSESFSFEPTTNELKSTSIAPITTTTSTSTMTTTTTTTTEPSLIVTTELATTFSTKTTEPILTSTSTSTTTPISTTLAPFLSVEFCPGSAKNIDCSASGDFVYILDAFFGVSDQEPAICEYK